MNNIDKAICKIFLTGFILGAILSAIVFSIYYG